jgi:excisionase family DNA binding protein
MPTPLDDALTMTAARKVLGCSRSKLYDLIGRGEITAWRVGTGVRISSASIEAYRERHRVKPKVAAAVPETSLRTPPTVLRRDGINRLTGQPYVLGAPTKRRARRQASSSL